MKRRPWSITILYTKIKLLGGIQFPWRMLSGLIFIPGILIAYLIDKVHKYKQVIIFFLVVVIAFFQFPQLYGKNYALYPQSNYFFTRTNLHGEILNTIWTGKTEDYPVEKNKIAIISGKGTITNEIVKNSLREYDLNASTPIRIADYTFYFPGWHVFANGVDTTIQFQDPKYRGVITYELPAGDYHIQDIFKNTKIRTLGDIITVIVGVLVLLFFIAEIKFSCLQKQLFR